MTAPGLVVQENAQSQAIEETELSSKTWIIHHEIIVEKGRVDW